jgi:hypothetical protein
MCQRSMRRSAVLSLVAAACLAGCAKMPGRDGPVTISDGTYLQTRVTGKDGGLMGGPQADAAVRQLLGQVNAVPSPGTRARPEAARPRPAPRGRVESHPLAPVRTAPARRLGSFDPTAAAGDDIPVSTGRSRLMSRGGG